MRRQIIKPPKSSFLGIPKDMSIIIDRILSNQNVLKLLEYNVKDWQSQPDVTGEQIKRMFDTEQISNIPRIKIDKERKTYLRLTMGTTIPNAKNPHYRDNTFGIDIISHYDDWNIGNFDTRPLRIAGEIDSMLDETHLTGIGVLHFVNQSPTIYNNEYAGVSLTYLAVRGDDDKVQPVTDL